MFDTGTSSVILVSRWKLDVWHCHIVSDASLWSLIFDTATSWVTMVLLLLPDYKEMPTGLGLTDKEKAQGERARGLHLSSMFPAMGDGKADFDMRQLFTLLFYFSLTLVKLLTPHGADVLVQTGLHIFKHVGSRSDCIPREVAWPYFQDLWSTLLSYIVIWCMVCPVYSCVLVNMFRNNEQCLTLMSCWIFLYSCLIYFSLGSKRDFF